MNSSPVDHFLLNNRRVLVTGASSGIGKGIAILLSRLGAKVICSGRDEERLQKTFDKLEGSGHAFSSFNLLDVEDIRPWIGEISKHQGKLWGIVHAAGISHTLPVSLIDREKFEQVVTLNAEAAFFLAKAMLSASIRDDRGGSIVFISSIMSMVSQPAISSYSFSKAALTGLTKSLAIEFAPKNIRVNCVSPAYVRTPLLDDMIKKWGKDQIEELISRHPLGLGEIQDVAYSTAFLLSEAARWITGSNLLIDGGYTAL
jgi:NAD(P)-dependent dehydrogenase (short-subunit alcohol dehydrogenase family)